MRNGMQENIPIDGFPGKSTQTGDIQVKQYSGGYARITREDFYLNNQPATLALAFISSGPGFPEVCRHLQSVAGVTRLLAVATAGELCSTGEPSSLYCTNTPSSGNIILQLFSENIISDISIQAVPLFSEDIRHRHIVLSKDQRVAKIKEALQSLSVPFPVSARDTLALVFIDGLSSSESYLMEAIYESGRFPCLFVGGSSGKKPDYRETYLFDGKDVLLNHAVLTFCKMAKGAQFGAFKTQNFTLTDKSFVVIEVESELHVVKTVISPNSTELLPIATAMQRMMGCPPGQLEKHLSGHTFGVILNGEVFINSVKRINDADGSVEFYCDVSPGDELFLLKATDFVEQTSNDIANFLRNKPHPVGAILNDCMLRRINNGRELANLDNAWNFPAAGYSTFGELFGIPVNQTLSAIVFFKNEDGQMFHDKFIDEFPIHYASYMNYFNRRRLSQDIILSRMRMHIVQILISFMSESNRLNQSLGLLIDEPDINEGKLLEVKMAYENQLKTVGDFIKISGMLSSIDKSVRLQNPSPDKTKDYRDPARVLYDTFYSNVVLGLRLCENIINLNKVRHAEQTANETLKAYTRDLENSNRELDDFAYIASHDLKEPLRGMQSFSHFMLEDYEDKLDEEGKRKLHTISDLAKRLDNLLNVLLQYSRLGRTALATGNVNMGDIVRNSVGFFAISLKEKNVTIDIAQDWPTISCDRVRIGEVFRNLIGNALKYTDKPENKIEIGYMTDHPRAPGEHAFYVRDNGIGIPEKFLDSIFKIFKRLHAKEAYGGGTGSGLAIAKKIIQQHGGQIWAESKGEGQGATFYFTLPQKK